MIAPRHSNAEFRAELETRTRAFAIAVFKLLDAMPKKPSTKVIAFQLGKSASSIGANYSEATRAESREDFGHKIQIALKEAAESCYWLSILAQLYPMHAKINALESEATGLRNVLQSIGRSVRRRLNPNTQTPKHPNTKL